MIKALGVLFGFCVLLLLLLVYDATDIDSQAHFDRLGEHSSHKYVNGGTFRPLVSHLKPSLYLSGNISFIKKEES